MYRSASQNTFRSSLSIFTESRGAMEQSNPLPIKLTTFSTVELGFPFSLNDLVARGLARHGVSVTKGMRRRKIPMIEVVTLFDCVIVSLDCGRLWYDGEGVWVGQVGWDFQFHWAVIGSDNGEVGFLSHSHGLNN